MVSWEITARSCASGGPTHSVSLRQVLRGTTGRGGECIRAGEPASAVREQYSCRGSPLQSPQQETCVEDVAEGTKLRGSEVAVRARDQELVGSQGGVIREHRRPRVGVVARSSFPRYEAIFLYYIE